MRRGLSLPGIKEFRDFFIGDPLLAIDVRGHQIGLFTKSDDNESVLSIDNSQKFVGSLYSGEEENWGAENDLSRLFIRPRQAQLAMNGSGDGVAVWSDVYPGTGDLDRFEDHNVHINIFNAGTKSWEGVKQVNDQGGGRLFWDFNTQPLVTIDYRGTITVVWWNRSRGFHEEGGSSTLLNDTLLMNQYMDDPENPGQKKWTGESVAHEFTEHTGFREEKVRLWGLVSDLATGGFILNATILLPGLLARSQLLALGVDKASNHSAISPKKP